MKISLTRDSLRRLALVALAAVAAATVVKGRERPVLDPVEPPASRIEAPTGQAFDLGALLRPQESPAPAADPFAPRSFEPPAKHAARSAPAQAARENRAPEVPPLPFAYFGRLTQAGKTEVFVMRGEELISIEAGRRIDHEYRVDAISESAIRFTYLPLGTSQSIELKQDG